MEPRRRAVLYGLLVWLVPFVVSVAIFPLKAANRSLFESILSVVVCGCAVFFASAYLARVKRAFLREGIVIGVIWLVISLVLDLMLFMEGPMKMPLGEYMSQIGLDYLMIPAMCIGLGYSLAQRTGEARRNEAGS